MQDANEHAITSEVLSSLSDCETTRIREISEALVQHLHAFVREIEPTEQEWAIGIDFLTRVGQMCDSKRQEFILLSDTLGVSMLVDAINHRLPTGATETTVLGPFYVEDPPTYSLGADLSEGIDGVPMFIQGSVFSEDGDPVADAVVDIWQSDDEGYYDVQHLDRFALRGRLHTDEQGRFWCWSIRPEAYPIPDDGPVGEMLKKQARHPYRPAHVHFKIQAAGYETLITQLYREGDKYLDSDVVFGVKQSLIHPYPICEPGTSPDGQHMDRSYVHLKYEFGLKKEKKTD